MGATILYQEQPPYDSAATAEGPDLWMPSGELHAATGWELPAEVFIHHETHHVRLG